MERGENRLPRTQRERDNGIKVVGDELAYCDGILHCPDTSHGRRESEIAAD